MRIGFLQLRPKFGAVKINVRKTKSLLDKVSDATIVLPELFNTGYLFRNEEELASLAERVPSGYTTSELKKVAKRRAARKTPKKVLQKPTSAGRVKKVKKARRKSPGG